MKTMSEDVRLAVISWAIGALVLLSIAWTQIPYERWSNWLREISYEAMMISLVCALAILVKQRSH